MSPHLNFCHISLPVFFKPGHYDIAYTLELLESLSPEDRSALLLYDNDFLPLYQNVPHLLSPIAEHSQTYRESIHGDHQVLCSLLQQGHLWSTPRTSPRWVFRVYVQSVPFAGSRCLDMC